MKVYDITLTKPASTWEQYQNSGWVPTTSEYDVPDYQATGLTKQMLQLGYADVTADFICMFRYVLINGAWKLLAKEANYDSAWGPKMTVFT